MKKIVALLLVLCMLVPMAAMAEVKLGQVDFAAHGTKCFAVITVAVDGDTIVSALIDEFQWMPADAVVGVPNAENFTNADGQVLASKRLNAEYYSGNMASHAGATMTLDAGYEAIEAFAVGKTIDELAAAIEGKTSAEMLDAVTGCTLVDTLGYLTGILEAAKAAQ